MGQVSEDINVDYDGKTIRELGGAVVYSGFVAGNLGHKVGVLPKSNNPMQIEELFAKAGNVKVFPAYSKTNTSIENRYHTSDKEKRTSIALSRIEPYQVSDMPDVDTKMYILPGLCMEIFRKILSITFMEKQKLLLTYREYFGT